MKMGDSRRLILMLFRRVQSGLICFRCGRVPRGRMIEIFGPESSENNIGFNIVAESQKKVVFGLYRRRAAMDPDYARKLGVEIKEL